jgi:hypothetical protein
MSCSRHNSSKPHSALCRSDTIATMPKVQSRAQAASIAAGTGLRLRFAPSGVNHDGSGLRLLCGDKRHFALP